MRVSAGRESGSGSFDPLVTARQAWAFIDSLAADGGWRRTPGGKSNHSFYHGDAGILLFLTELVSLRAVEPARLRRAADAHAAWVGAERTLSCNLPHGWSGQAFVMHCLAEALGEPGYREVASHCIEHLIAAARPLGAGLGWIEPTPFSDITGITGEAEVVDLSVGAAGALLALIHAHRHGLSERALDTALGVGERLLELGEPAGDGLDWKMMAEMPFPFPAPNFAHGASGVAFALAELAELSGQAKFLDAAARGLGHTLSREIAQPGGGGLIVHLEGARPPRYYLGVCHGPPGTGRALLRLHDLTGEARWLEALRRLVRGLEGADGSGARTWKNRGQCCGDAGIGDFALLLHRRGLWDEGLAFAEHLGRDLLAASDVTGEARSWLQDEHRARPDFLERQSGYMQGAAGIGSFFLHLETQKAGEPVGLYPLDWPRTDPLAACDPAAAGC